MARTFAQIYLTIWNDPDFKALTSAAQHLYFVMLTHPTLTSCGVMDWRENRLLAFCADWDSDTLRQAAWELGQATHTRRAADTIKEEARNTGGDLA